MIIKYLIYSPDKKTVINEVNLGESKERITIIDLGRHPRSRWGERFREHAAHGNADGIILRCNLNEIEAIANDPILPSLLRAEGVAALVSEFEKGRYRMSLRRIPNLPEFKVRLLPDEIREIEILSVLKLSSAEIFDQSAHFQLPSGQHAEKFISIQRIVNDQVTLTRIVDWVLPFVEKEMSLLSDHPTMLPLLLQAKMILEKQFAKDVQIDVLNGYPFGASNVRAKIRTLRGQAPGNKPILFFLSVNSSGKLAKMFTSFAPKGSAVVALLHTKTTTPRELLSTFASVPITKWAKFKNGKCDKCRSSKIYRIDRLNYELRPDVKQSLVMPNRKYAGSKKDFWEAATRAKAVQLHSLKPYEDLERLGTRHHAIYLDTGLLCSDVKFRASCVERLRSITAPNLVVIPSHANSKTVADIIGESFPKQSPSIIISSPTDLPDQLRKYPNAKRILIADDGIVTGRTLLTFKHIIYTVYQGLGTAGETQLEAFTILFRPDTLDVERALSLPFGVGNHFHYVVLVYLPLGESCPWCEEREFLRDISPQLNGPAREYAKKRISELDTPGTPRPERGLYTYGSYFGELTSYTAFAAASSVALELGLNLDSNPDPFKIVSVDIASTIEAYFEEPLLSGLLRTFEKAHVLTAQHDRQVSDYLTRYPNKHAYPGTIAELAWAAVLEKLPARPIMNLIGPKRDIDPMFETYMQILDMHN